MSRLTLTRVEAADRLGISPVTLADWARTRKIGSVKVGREVRFTPQQLEDFLAANERKPLPTTGLTRRSKRAQAARRRK